MKRIRFVMFGLVLLSALPLLASELKLGKPIEVTVTTTIKDLLASPDKYLGKNVRIEGEITEVCQMMGCWIRVKDTSSKETIQVKVEDGEIEFPKDGAGRKAVVQGKLEKLVLSKDQYAASLQHEAEESGKKVDTSKITEGKTMYRLRGQGAVIN